MFDMDVDVACTEFVDMMNDDNFMEINLNGETYEFTCDSLEIHGEISMRFEQNESFKLWKECFQNIDSNPKLYNEEALAMYLEQRPDVELLYDEILEKLSIAMSDYEYIYNQYIRTSEYIKYCDRVDLLEKHEYLVSEKERLEIEIRDLKIKRNIIMNDVNNFYDLSLELNKLDEEIIDFENEYAPFLEEQDVDSLIMSDSSDNDKAYYSKIKCDIQKYYLLLEKRDILKEEHQKYIVSAITLDDIKDKLKGYDSTIGVVPAGEWDTHKNPNYYGYGYETGMLGSFEGPQGKETGYDSRKGEEKTNYKDPDRSLLDFLSSVTDKDGNVLYPESSFEKGGEYYYHIFGVNDDGSINWNLIDNPRFGCKMLGNYLVVGCDQRFNRERGSKVITSLGPAIVFDYGTIENLEEDPSHIDISMDEVLFWLKNYSHNQDKIVTSLAGIYDWCTKEDFNGTIDAHYEHMERNYVYNINVAYQTNYVCIFDRDDFENMTTYDSQEDFAYKLTY